MSHSLHLRAGEMGEREALRPKNEGPVILGISAWRRVVIALVLAGVAIRLAHYLARASYWSDEAFLVLNIIDHPMARLMGPLDYGQACPPAFLWVERCIALTFGHGEYAMRLVPLLAGCAALGVFAVLAWRLFSPPVAACAVAWFAFADRFVSYSAELKQYESDALLAVVLFFILLAWRSRVSDHMRFLLVAVITAVGIWFSHTLVFIFGGVGLVLGLRCLRAGRLLPLAVGSLLILFSLLELYMHSIRLEHDPFLYEFWGPGFPPYDRPLHIPAWLVSRLYQLCGQPFPRDVLTPLVVILFITGIVAAWRCGGWDLLACGGVPIVLALVAAFLRQYPFSPGRLTLFLLPGLLLLCARGAECLRHLTRTWRFPGWAVLALPLAIYGAIEATTNAIHPPFRSHIRPVVEYLKAHRRGDEPIYITGPFGTHSTTDPYGRHVELFCYWRHPPGDVENLVPPPARLPHGRFWIVFPFSTGHGRAFIQPLLEQVRQVAVQQGEPFIEKRGGAAYLFERGEKQAVGGGQ